jgi:hypothetical protein
VEAFVGGKGSGQQHLAHLSPEEKRIRKIAMARARWLRIRGTEEFLEKQRANSRVQGQRRKELRKTPEGRAEWMAYRRTALWPYWLRHQCVRSARARGLAFDKRISAAWIREQFERQSGRCFYTGVAFEIVEKKRGIRRPSLDRLDPLVGYTPENVVLCLTAMNYMKNDYGLDEFRALLDEIRLTPSPRAT